METLQKMTILVPIEIEEFWCQIRLLIRQELNGQPSQKSVSEKAIEVSGFIYKPYYDMNEVRKLFNNVSRTTIYEWVRNGKLKPKKMKGKIYFLWSDIEKKMNEL